MDDIFLDIGRFIVKKNEQPDFDARIPLLSRGFRVALTQP
jgi:hypothetical protein